MSNHPLNLALRFGLELGAWIGLGVWGWTQNDGPWRYLLAVGLPLISMALWTIFAVPNDPSRSGKAPVPTPGWLRLLLELATFCAGSWALIASGYTIWGGVLAVLTLIHYVTSTDRIRWLLQQ